MRALIGLGCNLGARERTLLGCRECLPARGIRVLQASSVWESEAMGWKGGPRFLNAVLEVESTQRPFALRRQLREIELSFGRRPDQPRNAPRELDLDLLACRGVTIFSRELSLPHPRASGRPFVTVPLRELHLRPAWDEISLPNEWTAPDEEALRSLSPVEMPAWGHVQAAKSICCDS